MKIEDFIKLRKAQDQVNEFDIDKKVSNLHQFVDYVFEYFELYIDVDSLERRRIEKDEKLVKYQKRLSHYSLDVQNWLIDIYTEYDIQLIGPLRKCVIADQLFLLYFNPNGWRKFTVNAYATLKKKHPYLEDYLDELYLFTVDESRRLNINHLSPVPEDIEMVIPESILKWIRSVGKNKKIDLLAWCSDYTSRFFDQEKIWPQSHLYKEGDNVYYDIRVKKNRFNLDNLYQKFGEFDYLKGKKKYLDLILLYCWVTEIDPKFEDYFAEYVTEFS